ncbi:LysR family transcriptional regulator [Kiloniella majae]|uniref:LysR family transcriptional regulator n=1 Tax=Kiloniella majae TaxID=1938558 RepID=UPI000A279820|nr:LysR family transcriptional regulator [Kiloniella majae]
MNNMHWNDLKVFAAVVQKGSLSAAGRYLGLSQPTIGRHIDSLEKALNKKLFNRGSKGYVLTEQGLELLPHIEAMERASLAIEEHDQSEISGIVRLSLPEITSRYLGKRLLPLQKLYPDIKLEIATSNQFVNLSRREADIALRTELPAQGDLRTKLAFRTQAAIFASHQYTKLNPAALTEERYQNCDWIVPIWGRASKQAEDWYKDKMHTSRVAYRCASFHVMMDLALAGAGLILWTSGYAKDHAGLVRVSEEITSQQRDYWLVSHSGALEQPRVRAVWDWISTLFEQERSKFIL